MKELSYINEQGDNVYTAQYYLNKGYCCKSNCLHCPFGTTVKNLGIQFTDVSETNFELAQSLIKQNIQDVPNVSNSLLDSAFGGKKKKLVLTKDNMQSFKLCFLKEQVFGIIQVGKFQCQELYLHQKFKDQGLNKDLVQSYLFT